MKADTLLGNADICNQPRHYITKHYGKGRPGTERGMLAYQSSIICKLPPGHNGDHIGTVEHISGTQEYYWKNENGQTL